LWRLGDHWENEIWVGDFFNCGLTQIDRGSEGGVNKRHNRKNMNRQRSWVWAMSMRVDTKSNTSTKDAPRLRPALPFQEIIPAFVSFETLLGIISLMRVPKDS
jgi:hypothetical protein